MGYEINVSKNGLHYFATADRSLGLNFEKTKQLYNELKTIFTEDKGFNIIVTNYENIGNKINMDILPKISNKLSFNDVFNSLPINELFIVKDPKMWFDWKSDGVITVNNIVTMTNDDNQVCGIHIPKIQDYRDADFDVLDYDVPYLKDSVDGFYCFPNKEDATIFLNKLP